MKITSPYNEKLKAKREIEKIEALIQKIKDSIPVAIAFIISATIVILAWKYPF